MGDRILITGANGFVGSALRRKLQDTGYFVRASVRNEATLPRKREASSTNIGWKIIHDRSTEDELKDALEDVHTIVHLAARVHIMTDHASDPLHEFRQVNTNWTERLARTAASQGVHRFVFLSSIKVNGEQSIVPFTEQDVPKPEDPYSLSKWKAEQALATISARTGMEIVIVRSPLIYGPGVRGNFLQLMRVIQQKIPLPFASIHNLRSLIYRGNLVDALIRCVQDGRAAGHTYLISDGEDLSTPELIRRLSRAMGINTCLWSIPSPLLYWLGQVIGKRIMLERLLGSLRVDSSKIRQELAWDPPFSIDEGLVETAAWFSARSPI